ncbi:hypothetical protein ACFQ9U_17545 [Streptomyces sp. NPDC056568]|uniref:hypothetical protein n=1 Tax=Streptomyces sp. NPDC056568 TaxID=3345866 RepID=UPI0036BB0DB7
MTVLDDRIEMAEESAELTLDVMFEWLEKLPVPYSGEWHLHTLPQDGKYHSTVGFGFGVDVDLTGTVVGLTLRTDDFPRD